MQGADEAHYLQASQNVPRLIEFPDGICRHINLSKWQWEVFDRLITDKGWSKEELPVAAFELALEGMTYPDDFEKQLRHSFELFIRENMSYVMAEEDVQPSNDEY